MRSFEQDYYEAVFSEFIRRLRKESLVQTEPSLSMRCRSDTLTDVCFASNHEYSANNSILMFKLVYMPARNAILSGKLIFRGLVYRTSVLVKLLWPFHFRVLITRPDVFKRSASAVVR